MTNSGACILGIEGLTLSSDEIAFLREARPFGFILFARNIDTADQVRSLCRNLRYVVGHNAPIMIDQEGGRVQRLCGPTWRDWLPPMEQVKSAGAYAADAMYARYRIIAHELFHLGIDANCAPLVDVARRDTHPFLKNRCYCTNAIDVAKLGKYVAKGLLHGGVLPVVKHIPGHGRAQEDSHHDLPRVTTELATLRETDFAPFAALRRQTMAMTAHVVYQDIDDLPATLSPKMISLIRDEIGFGGLLMTDDISMKALDGELSELCQRSLDAGCDVVLHCNGNLREAMIVAKTCGTLSGKALKRAKSVLAARKKPKSVDIPALEAKLAELLQVRNSG